MNQPKNIEEKSSERASLLTIVLELKIVDFILIFVMATNIVIVRHTQTYMGLIFLLLSYWGL